MAKEKTGVYEMELSEKKVAYLSNPAVKEGLLIYLTSNSKIASARWDSARGFKQAFDNRDKETVINEDGKPVPRWDTKSKFYKFVGITDANGSQLFNAVDFDDNNTVDGRKLSEVGFTVGKVYALSSMLEDGEFLEFLEYGAKVVASDRIEDIARLSDKGLINLIKSFHASKEQEQEQEQETATKQEQETATKQEQEQEQETATKQEQEQETATKQEQEQETATDVSAVDEMTKDDKALYIFGLMDSIGISLIELCEYKREHDKLTVKYDAKNARFTYSAK